MISIGSFALLRPGWLLCLPVVWLFVKFTRSRHNALGDWPAAIDPPLLDALVKGKNKDPGGNGDRTLIWCAVLIIISLASPAVRTAASSQFRNLDATLIILNVPGGFNQSKTTTAAQIVLNGGGARQTGLILYAGDAYLASPLTYDPASIEALIFAIDDHTVPDGGARPDRALMLAHRLLRRMDIIAADVVLIGDGEGINAQVIEEAKILAADGHSLHTVFIPSFEANILNLSKSRAAMKQLADDGHGIAGDPVSVLTVAETIASRKINHVAKDSRLALEWRDLGRNLIVLAALPLLVFFRRSPP